MGRKDLESLNAFSIKHNEINPENPIPLFEFDRLRKFMYTRAVEKSTPTLGGWIRRENENGKMIWTRLTKMLTKV